MVFRLGFFVLTFVFTGAALAWIGWSTYGLYADDSVIKGQIWRTEELRSTIVHLDEVNSTSALPTEQQACLDAGASIYLTKPSDLTNIGNLSSELFRSRPTIVGR